MIQPEKKVCLGCKTETNLIFSYQVEGKKFPICDSCGQSDYTQWGDEFAVFLEKEAREYI